MIVYKTPNNWGPLLAAQVRCLAASAHRSTQVLESSYHTGYVCAFFSRFTSGQANFPSSQCDCHNDCWTLETHLSGYAMRMRQTKSVPGYLYHSQATCITVNAL